MARASLQWKQKMEFLATTGSGHNLTLDAREAVGGENHGPRPAELVLVALAGCTAMDVVSILRKMRIDFTRVDLEVSGKEAEEHPKVFTKIDVLYKVEGTDVPPEKLERAIVLSRDRYCVVSNLIKTRAAINYAYQINSGPVVALEMLTT